VSLGAAAEFAEVVEPGVGALDDPAPADLGFGLARALDAAGIDCLVAAPSRLLRPTGDRVKADAKDALHLARLLAVGEVCAVAVPDEETEAVQRQSLRRRLQGLLTLPLDRRGPI
jgi:transposase